MHTTKQLGSFLPSFVRYLGYPLQRVTLVYILLLSHASLLPPRLWSSSNDLPTQECIVRVSIAHYLQISYIIVQSLCYFYL